MKIRKLVKKTGNALAITFSREERTAYGLEKDMTIELQDMKIIKKKVT